MDTPVLYPTRAEAEAHREHPDDVVVPIGGHYAVMTRAEYLQYSHHC